MIKVIFDKSVEKIFRKLENSSKTEDKVLLLEIVHAINLLQKHANDLKMPFSRNIKGYKGLKELRISTTHLEYRIFYFIHKGVIGVLLSGTEKKAQKLNANFFKQALKKMKEYIKYIDEKGVDNIE